MKQTHGHRRNSTRLKGYDYTQAGAYFVTICTHQRLLYFEDETIRVIAEDCWKEIPAHHPAVVLDEWVIMPNHIHGILILDDAPSRRGVQLNAPTAIASGISGISPRKDTLAIVVRTYKAAVTTACRRQGMSSFGWQRNYHDHIIRSERELNAVREYIQHNPLQWELDENHPSRMDRTRSREKRQ